MNRDMSRNWIASTALPVHYQVRMVDGMLDPDNRALLEAGATRRSDTIHRLNVCWITKKTTQWQIGIVGHEQLFLTSSSNRSHDRTDTGRDRNG